MAITNINASDVVADSRAVINANFADLQAQITALSASSVSSGAGAPGTTPSAIGNQYVDTTAGNIYYAVGTSSSADWRLLASYS